jgi:hypothetical protein
MRGRMVIFLTGMKRTREDHMRAAAINAGDRDCLGEATLDWLYERTYRKEGTPKVERGPETKVGWMHLLSVAACEAQRLTAAVGLLEEYKLAVDEMRATALTLDKPASGRQVVNGPSAKRVTQRLVRLRDTWEPGAAGWLSHVVGAPEGHVGTRRGSATWLARGNQGSRTPRS